jgi:hypothetical protein
MKRRREGDLPDPARIAPARTKGQFVSLPDDSALTSATIDFDSFGSAATRHLGRRTRAAVDNDLENASIFVILGETFLAQTEVSLARNFLGLRTGRPAAHGHLCKPIKRRKRFRF